MFSNLYERHRTNLGSYGLQQGKIQCANFRRSARFRDFLAFGLAIAGVSGGVSADAPIGVGFGGIGYAVIFLVGGAEVTSSDRLVMSTKMCLGTVRFNGLLFF
jgi:hypothetical protein